MKNHSMTWLLVATVAISASIFGCAATTNRSAETEATDAASEINRNFLDTDLDVDEWIERFEAESREVYAARDEIVRTTGVEAGGRVADIGAGTGFFTRLFAEATGSDGWVYAVDIAPRFLEHINDRAHQASIDNVTAIYGRTDTVALPPESIDLAFVCDTYHHFEEVEPILASIRRALVPGGDLVIIDFERIPGESRQWTLDHVRAGKEVFRAEIEAAGFTFVEEVEIPALEENYFLKFEKR